MSQKHQKSALREMEVFDSSLVTAEAITSSSEQQCNLTVPVDSLEIKDNLAFTCIFSVILKEGVSFDDIAD